MIGLLDANNFFVSCERVFRPDLRTRPVVVLSNNDGCVIARSNEVKALGVPMGAPYFQYKEVLADHHVTIFSSHFSLYGDLSGRMMTLIDTMVPRMEVYSIDEAFMDFSGIRDRDLERFCHHIRNTIGRCLGIPTSIGVSKTKTLAKVANYYAKRIPAFQSICLLQEDHRIDQALKRLSVGEVWGIGRQITKKLEGQGIGTAYDLKNVDPRCMRQRFSVVGERIVRELNGVSCLELEDMEAPRKSIQVTRSFSKAVTELEDMKSLLATYATRLGQKLRDQGLVTQTILVSIRTSKFRHQEPQYANSHTLNLPSLIQDDISLIKAAIQALQKIYKQGFAYAKAGIMALDLVPKGQRVQLDLFSQNQEDPFQAEPLWEAVDAVNKKYGRGTLFSAACGKSLTWKDQKGHLSPPYTTNWKYLPLVFAK